MIISHSKKFAFFANPKTGSKAVGFTLRLSNAFDDDVITSMNPMIGTRTAKIEMPARNLAGHESHLVDHMLPSEAIEAGFITLEQLREYNCYAFLRNPEDRYLAIRIVEQVNRHGKIAPIGYKPKHPPPPQHKYFYVGDEQVVTALDFDEYGDGIRTMIAALGGTNHLDVPEIINTSRPKFVHNVTYNPQQHLEDEKLYRIMKNGKQV